MARAAPRPQWLKYFRPNGDSVEVKERQLTLFVQRLKPGASIRISGNMDQGINAGVALNLILFARPVGSSTASN